MIIFLGGRTKRNEFVELSQDVRELAARFGAALIERELIKADATLANVDFFLLLRSFPNEFSKRETDRLREIAPLAPIAIVAGKLCESENVTGESFPGARRFYPWNWRTMGRREMIRFFDASGAKGLFAESPLTPDSEFWASRRPAASERTSLSGETVLILCDDCSLAELLGESFERVGAVALIRSWTLYDASSFGDLKPTRVVLDVDCFLDDATHAKIQSVRDRFPDSSFELLLFSPSESERLFFEESARGGAFRVISKPFEVETALGVARGASDRA